MLAGIRLTLSSFEHVSGLFALRSSGRFGLGVLLGVVAVSMWQQFSLLFGLDPVLTLSCGIVLSLTLWRGEQWSLRQSSNSSRLLPYLICCLCVVSLLHPFWLDAVTTFLRVIPAAWLASSVMKPIVAMAIAGACWTLPGLLWGAVLTRGSCRTSPAQSGPFPLFAGLAIGLLLNAVVLAPGVGYFYPQLFASVLGIGVSLWLRQRLSATESTSVCEMASPSENASAQAVISAGMALLIGSLLACQLRLLNQLMPHGAYVVFVQAAGILAGIALALAVQSLWRSKQAQSEWIGLGTAAASSLLIAVHPSLVDLSLWMNSTLINVTSLTAARVILLMSTVFPFGFALAQLIKSVARSAATDVGGKDQPAGANRFAVSESGFGVPAAIFLLGLSFATFLLGGAVSSFTMIVICCGMLLALSAWSHIESLGWTISLRSAAVGGCLTMMALSLPLWRFHDDASRTAKVLFSTPAFLAYRSGWDVKQLSALDDLRLIHRQENANGSLTLWRGRVAELYIREGGIPRSVLTKTSEVVPQFAPEVLQTVYSFVMSDRPGRVMLLGLSAGVSLSTCLEFPVREVICVEGDSSLVDLVRGPLARETGLDPLLDERVTLQPVSPELALMVKPEEPFDVILSSPPSSAMTAGASQFTTEFYQHASTHLAERGLFCQRFECVDYGPQPLQIVMKSMQQAFRQTIAIETAPGEFLLFGTNAEDLFIPGDLASRLEMPHVVRILARSGMDWSALLNLPAFDHDALKEICDDTRLSANTSLNGVLAALTPLEVMRWAGKQQEVQAVLTSTRVSKAPFWIAPATDEPNQLDQEVHLSRQSRLVEWLGDHQVSLETLRRLREVTTQHKLVYENPDAHWWEYRKALRKQLQDHPRTAVQQVKAIDEKRTLHPEDVRRRDYFAALGNAVDRKKTPTRTQIAAVEAYLEPYDPLLSYFARQEIADLLARCDEDAGRELAYRLHVIYFSPTRDASVRNVATALETLVKHPDAIPDDSTRYDAYNGLIQTMRTRWETRQFISETSAKKVVDDVDKSIIAVEKGVDAMETLAPVAGVPDAEWKMRKQVIDRLLLRPLRAYRNEIRSRQDRSQKHAKAIFDNLNPAEESSQDE